MRYLIGVAALLSLAGTAPAQWGSGSGPPPGPVGPFIRVQTGAAPFQPVPLPPTYEWHVSKSNPDRLNLWCDGQNIGAFWESSSTYHRFVGPGWSDPREPPIALPGSRRAITQNFGLDLSKFNGAGPRYWVNGVQVSKEQAYQALVQKGELKDDSAQNWLVVIGPDSTTAPVKKDLETHPALAAYKGKLRVQVADPVKYFALAQKYGYVQPKSGGAMIYLQGRTGKVLHRQEGYAGPEKLAEAIRKADPSYDPSRDPDLNRPAPLLPGLDLSKLLGQVPQWLWGLLGGAALIFFLTRKPQENK